MKKETRRIGLNNSIQNLAFPENEEKATKEAIELAFRKNTLLPSARHRVGKGSTQSDYTFEALLVRRKPRFASLRSNTQNLHFLWLSLDLSSGK